MTTLYVDGVPHTVVREIPRTMADHSFQRIVLAKEDGVFSYEHLETGNPDLPHDNVTTLPAHLLRAVARDALCQMADNWQAPDPERMAVIVADWADAADRTSTTSAELSTT